MTDATPLNPPAALAPRCVFVFSHNTPSNHVGLEVSLRLRRLGVAAAHTPEDPEYLEETLQQLQQGTGDLAVLLVGCTCNNSPGVIQRVLKSAGACFNERSLIVSLDMGSRDFRTIVGTSHRILSPGEEGWGSGNGNLDPIIEGLTHYLETLHRQEQLQQRLQDTLEAGGSRIHRPRM